MGLVYGYVVNCPLPATVKFKSKLTGTEYSFPTDQNGAFSGWLTHPVSYDISVVGCSCCNPSSVNVTSVPKWLIITCCDGLGAMDARPAKDEPLAPDDPVIIAPFAPEDCEEMGIDALPSHDWFEMVVEPKQEEDGGPGFVVKVVYKGAPGRCPRPRGKPDK